MDALKYSERSAMTRLKGYRNRLTSHQYKTLRGQVLAGNADGALKGLQKILSRERKAITYELHTDEAPGPRL